MAHDIDLYKNLEDYLENVNIDLRMSLIGMEEDSKNKLIDIFAYGGCDELRLSTVCFMTPTKVPIVFVANYDGQDHEAFGDIKLRAISGVTTRAQGRLFFPDYYDAKGIYNDLLDSTITSLEYTNDSFVYGLDVTIPATMLRACQRDIVGLGTIVGSEKNVTASFVSPLQLKLEYDPPKFIEDEDGLDF